MRGGPGRRIAILIWLGACGLAVVVALVTPYWWVAAIPPGVFLLGLLGDRR